LGGTLPLSAPARSDENQHAALGRTMALSAPAKSDENQQHPAFDATMNLFPQVLSPYPTKTNMLLSAHP